MYKKELEKKRLQKFTAESVDRTRDLQIFSLTLSQLSYRGSAWILGPNLGQYQRSYGSEALMS